MLKYEIANDNVVLIFDEDSTSGIPLISQPLWPNREPWGSKFQAELWAKAFVENRNNPDYPFEAGSSPSSPLVPRREPEEEVAP